MTRHVEVEPRFAKERGLHARCIRHSDDDHPLRSEDLAELLERAAWVAEVLERVPHRNAVEGAVLGHGHYGVVDFDPERRGARGIRAELRSSDAPTAFPGDVEKAAVPASDVEKPGIAAVAPHSLGCAFEECPSSPSAVTRR